MRNQRARRCRCRRSRVANACISRRALVPEHRMHRHHASPQRRHTAVQQCDASGVALCRGCAAAHSLTANLGAVPFSPAGRRSSAGSGDAADDCFAVSDSAFVFVGVASRPGCRLPSSASAVSVPFGRASLAPSLADARCASLARRLAALAAVPCLAATPVPGFGTVAIPPPASTLAGAARHARLRLRRRASARLAGIRCRERRLAPLAPRGVRSGAAAAPLRFVSGTSSPVVRYPGNQVYLTAYAVSALTPDAAGCRELDVPVFSEVSSVFAEPSRHQYPGKSVISLYAPLCQARVAIWRAFFTPEYRIGTSPLRNVGRRNTLLLHSDLTRVSRITPPGTLPATASGAPKLFFDLLLGKVAMRQSGLAWHLGFERNGPAGVQIHGRILLGPRPKFLCRR